MQGNRGIVSKNRLSSKRGRGVQFRSLSCSSYSRGFEHHTDGKGVSDDQEPPSAVPLRIE